MSDNAKAFKAAHEQFLSFMGRIVQIGGLYLLGPHRGEPGKNVWLVHWSQHWKNLIGKGSLSWVELETSLQEIEVCFNSRPLCFVRDELDSGTPLTPSCFLTGKSGYGKQTLVQNVLQWMLRIWFWGKNSVGRCNTNFGLVGLKIIFNICQFMIGHK